MSFFKSFPWKCSTPLNGPANAVAVRFWTAALLQDKLCSARRLSADSAAQGLRGREHQPATATWKSLINFFNLLVRTAPQVSPSRLPSPVTSLLSASFHRRPTATSSLPCHLMARGRTQLAEILVLVEARTLSRGAKVSTAGQKPGLFAKCHTLRKQGPSCLFNFILQK